MGGSRGFDSPAALSPARNGAGASRSMGPLLLLVWGGPRPRGRSGHPNGVHANPICQEGLPLPTQSPAQPAIRTRTYGLRDIEVRDSSDGLRFTGYAPVFGSPSEDLGG